MIAKHQNKRPKETSRKQPGKAYQALQSARLLHYNPGSRKGATMTQKELKKFTKDYCKDLQDEILSKVKLFQKVWGIEHVLAVTEMIVESYSRPTIKRARRQIKKSMTYYEMF